MNLSAVNAYKNPYVNSNAENLRNVADDTLNNVKRSTKASQEAKLTTGATNDPLLNTNERAFFQKLFPESSEQIEKHVLFTRNGKIQTPNIDRGSVFDGRA